MKTLNKPAYLEKSVIDDLSIITEKYWQLSVHTSLPLLNAVSGHLQTITQLLYEGQSAHLHCLLCTLASETAQILGKILFDLCEPNLAWAYYSLSLKAAEEAKHTELWSVGIGRIALLLAANGRPQEALSILQEAQQNPSKIISFSLGSPLSKLKSTWISINSIAVSTHFREQRKVPLTVIGKKTYMRQASIFHVLQDTREVVTSVWSNL
jgi:hypothetical protein